MSVSCQKPYSMIVPGAHLAAYWTFDESPLPANYTDSVNAQQLSTSVGNTVTPGLFGNASRSNQGGFQCGLQTPGFGDGSLGYTSKSKGFSFWYWLRIHVQPASNIFYQQLIWNFYDTINNFSLSIFDQVNPVTGAMQLAFVDNNSTQFTLNIPAGTFPSVTDKWYLIGGSYNNVAQTIQMFLNGVSVGSLSIAPVLGFVNTGQLKFENGNVDFTCVWDIDESGFSIDFPLSQTQWTALFNNGLGVTFPGVKSIVPTM